MTRALHVILWLFQVVGFFYFVGFENRNPFIAAFSGPHSKPAEVNTKTLTSVKFESSIAGQ